MAASLSLQGRHAEAEVLEREVLMSAETILGGKDDGDFIGAGNPAATLAQRPKSMPKPRYMHKQRDINHSMRSILVDWLVEVSQEYRLESQTLYMAVSYIDRFLSEMEVQRGKLQLVGVTALLLASKYEELYPPAVDEFVYITDNSCSRDQVPAHPKPFRP